MTATNSDSGEENGDSDVFAPSFSEGSPFTPAEKPHIIGSGIVCETDYRGQATPGGQSPLELVLDASEGFIPLWEKDRNLRYTFNQNSLSFFKNPGAARIAIKKLMGDALLGWGDAVPIRFTESSDASDFEIVVSPTENCNVNGCVLASAFFPDAGRHKLRIYPTMFQQSRKEQVETMAHEIGHIFGLRHFFADVSETAFPSEKFGTHKKFTIMNYGSDSQLTDADRSDLKTLYDSVWSGELKNINGTPIKQVRPYHYLGL